MIDFLNEVLAIEDDQPDAYQMGISGKSPAKVGGAMKGDRKYDPALHPKYPKGHPQGGQFMPKGGKDQVQAVAKAKGVSTEQAAAMVGGKANPNKGKLSGFGKGAGAVGKAQNVLKDKNSTPEQRDKAKASILKAKSNAMNLEGKSPRKSSLALVERSKSYGSGLSNPNYQKPTKEEKKAIAASLPPSFSAPKASKGKLSKFSGSAGAVGKAQKVLKSKDATPEQRAKAKASINKAAVKMRGDAPVATDKPKRGRISNKELMARNAGEPAPMAKAPKDVPKKGAKFSDEDLAETARQKKAGRMPKDELKGEELKAAEKRLADKLASINKGAKKAEAEEKPVSLPKEKKEIKPVELKTKVEPAKKDAKPKGESQPKIADYKSFKDEATKAAAKLNYEYNYDGTIPIHALRKELGGRVTREQFDEHLRKMGAEGHTTLEEGDIKNPDHAKDSLVSPISGLRVNAAFDKKQLPPPKQAKESKSKINTYEKFEEKALKVINDLRKKEGNTIPIHKLRESIGDDVNRLEFRDWLLEMESRNKFDIGGNQAATAKHREDSISTPLKGLITSIYLKR